jgi:aminopeptidase YwaD
MTQSLLAGRAQSYVQRLCIEIPDRCVGSPGNRAATDFFADTITSFDFATESPAFDCMDWTQQGATVSVGGQSFTAFVSPYSLGCAVRAPFTPISTIEELEAANVARQIVVLHGEIAREQLMPKNFTFYNPEEHQRVIRALESQQPCAIVAATSRNPQMAGALYPFPLIEDGDFDIPSVYMTDEEGRRLVEYAGQTLSLEIRAQRKPAQACNVIARKGAQSDRHVVLFAHVDAKQGTPGALDNAAGITTLLLLAELLSDYTRELGVEIVALNGEDYYSNPGEMQYLQLNAGRFGNIVLGINLDGVGYREGRTAYSLYDCPPDLSEVIQQVFASRPEFVAGEPWYQSDHSLFLMNQRPALALTSDRASELMTTIVHTAHDRPEILEVSKLVETALALRVLLDRV